MLERIYILSALIVGSYTVKAQCTYIAGNENPGFLTPATYGANYILGTHYNVPTPGTLVSLNFFGLGTNSNVQMCLYEDNAGVPGNLVTTSVAGVVTNGPVALSVTPQILPVGDYWLMAIFDNFGGTQNHCYYTTTTTQVVYYSPLTFGSPMPANASGFLTYCCQDFQYWMVIQGAESASDTIVSACDFYLSPAGNVYTVSGNYLDTLTNVSGCDSVITTDLTITNVDVNTSQVFNNLSADLAGASYQWLDCNNSFAVIAGETSQNFSTSVDGSYAVEIDDNGCVDTSACLLVNGLGIDNESSLNISVYPNPTTGNITIYTNQNHEQIFVRVSDLSGKIIFSEIYRNTNSAEVNLNVSSGIYLLEIMDETGQQRVLKISKE